MTSTPVRLSVDTAPFYLLGREAKRLPRQDVDVEACAEKIAQGEPVREAIYAACAQACLPYESSIRHKRKWQNKHADLVARSPISEEAAFAAYCQGMRDELAYMVEPDVIDCLEGADADPDDGHDDSGDPDDDEEEEDDDDDDDD